MASRGGRIGSPTGIVLLPEAKKLRARERQGEERSWSRRSGPVRSRFATGEELEAIRRGTWRPYAFVVTDDDQVASSSTSAEVES